MKIKIAVSSMQADHVIADLASWAKDRRLVLLSKGKPVDLHALPKTLYQLTVQKRGFRTSIGTVQLVHGKWHFVARPENADDYDLSNSDLSLGISESINPLRASTVWQHLYWKRCLMQLSE